MGWGGGGVEHCNSLSQLRYWYPAASLAILLPVNVLGNVAEDNPGSLPLDTCGGNGRSSRLLLWIGPAPATVAIWGMDLQMEDLSLCC